jgi:hypothetical protein
MDHNQSPVASRLSYTNEALFSWNLALVIVATIFLYNHALTSILFRMDASINRLLHIEQTDLVWGYWAFLLSGIALGLLIWLTVHFIVHDRFRRQLLRSVGGISALAALPIYWLCSAYSASHRYGWNPFHAIQFYELLVAVVCVSLYLQRNWPIPLWGAIFGILLHYGFWFWQFGTYYIVKGNGGPVILLPFVSLSASFAWVLYTRRLQRTGA